MQCNGNINQTFIIEGGETTPIISACTSVFTNQINSCSGNTSIILGTDTVDFTGAVSASTYYGDGSNLSGISTQDTYVTGFTYLNNDLTIKQPLQPDLVVNIDVMTGLTVDGVVSATTYYGDGSNLSGISAQDTYITGSTFSGNTLTLTNNTGGTINTNISSFDSISATTYENLPLDIHITGGTYTDNTLILTNNTGGTINTHIDTFTALTINTISATTISATTYVNLPSDVAFSGTYVELQAMVNNNELLVGKKYVLTDYKTIYQINGSNSENNIQNHTVIGSSSSYSQFNNVPIDVVTTGNTVICVYAPLGASIVTGQTFVIAEYFNTSYIRFTPPINTTNNYGSILKFEKQRYPNIPPNIVINDNNGKPVIKPGGVLNSEVHDNGPYMSMISSENPAPIIEKIVLTAIDINKFSIYAESLTFVGDTLTYDFNDNVINDENGYTIGSRNGFILKRTNVDNTISVDKDWRVQRYRRYGVDDVNFDGFLLKNTYNSTSATTIYKIGATNYCTTQNTNLNINHRYFLETPYKTNAYINFAKTVVNPFLSGVTTAPPVQSNDRFSTNFTSEYLVDISLPLSGLTGTTFAKDFTIIPLVNYIESTLITNFVVESLDNSVFLPFQQRNGTTFNLNVKSLNGTINNTTALTLPSIVNNGDIFNSIMIDRAFIENKRDYKNVNSLGNLNIFNNGLVNNVTFGSGPSNYDVKYVGPTSRIINTIIGTGTNNSTYFNDMVISSSLLVTFSTSVTNFTGNAYLTFFKSRATLFTSNIKILNGNSQIPNKGYYGYIYDFNVAINDSEIHNLNTRKNLIQNTVDTNNITSITTISTVQ